jgi:hypothetical protein
LPDEYGNPTVEDLIAEELMPHRVRTQKSYGTKHLTDEEKIQKAVERGLAKALSNQDGILAFQWLMGQCGHLRPSITASSAAGGADPDMSLYFEGQRSIWLKLRKMIKRDQLVQIENPEIRVIEPDERKEEDNEHY